MVDPLATENGLQRRVRAPEAPRHA